MTYNIGNCRIKFKIKLYWLWTYTITLISSIKYIYSKTAYECSVIYIWFYIMWWPIIIFIKDNDLFKSLIIIIGTLINIHSILGIKLAANFTITFSNIHSIKCTCIMSLFINIIIFKTNYYILWSFHTNFHT